MAKKKIKEVAVIYIPPPNQWFLFIGEKYYKRLQPIPYKKDKLPAYIKKFNAK
jgi:hypothetical protein